ncbi:hypothetical protein DM01DRAFT_1301503 [Hesseltinella vesiculosa]|uniref:SCP2 domain-containing protein n=1 Tax=Hesseltinella vesiculosa TaxID=101127 RepID=A0A1X2GPQ8_9FUNG|nr:hypothetical protein DM01DRAFT_1301503 [Hesseltinella vesiculosa]
MPPAPLICDIVLPEVERQLSADAGLWPNINGFFIVNVTKRRKPAATWFILLQGNSVQPIITKNPKKVQGIKKRKASTVNIRIEDSDLLNFITGGLTGIKGYVNRRIKIRGDLVLAQSLENLFEKSGGRQRALEFVKKNEHTLVLEKAKL